MTKNTVKFRDFTALNLRNQAKEKTFGSIRASWKSLKKSTAYTNGTFLEL